MDFIPQLDAYRQQRDRLFASVVGALEADERVVACWLSGAHGRHEDDEWSDFDLHVAVDDDAYAGIVSDPQPLFEYGGEVLLVQANFPSDSMPDGRFWLVIYEGLLEIDWNIGPASIAVRPRASQVLFEKASIPLAVDPPALAAEQAREDAQRTLEFFWAMVPIALKYTGRGWTRRAVQQEALLARALETLWRVVNGRPLRSSDTYDQNRPMEPESTAIMPRLEASIDGSDVVRVVREYCAAVERLHPALSEMGVQPPVALPGEVSQLADLADAAAKAGGSRPNSGSRR